MGDVHSPQTKAEYIPVQGSDCKRLQCFPVSYTRPWTTSE